MNLLSQTARRVGQLVAKPGVDERRFAPRMPRRLELRLSGLELYSTNVTQSGFQLACPVLWLPQLCGAWNPRAVEVEILLPLSGWMRALCEVVYLYDYDDEYLLGLRIKAFEKHAAGRWQAYIAQVASTAERRATIV